MSNNIIIVVYCFVLFFSYLERRGIEFGEIIVMIEVCIIRGKRFGSFFFCILIRLIEKGVIKNEK